MPHQNNTDNINENNKKEYLLISYKLLHDTLFLLILLFAITLISESILPKVLTSQISFFQILLLIFLNLVGIFIINSRKNFQNYIKNIQIKENKPKKNTLMLIFFTLLILNSQFEINMFLNIIITAIVLMIVILVFKFLFEEESDLIDQN